MTTARHAHRLELLARRICLLMSLGIGSFCGCESTQLESGGESGGEATRIEVSNAYGIYLWAIISHGEQHAQNWCWAACVSAVVNDLLGSGHGNMTQEDVVMRLFDGRSPDQGATLWEIAQAIDNKVMTFKFPAGGGQIRYHFKARPVSQLTPNLVRAIADGNHGFIYALQGHAVVLGRVTLKRNRESERITEVEIWDPWPRRGLRTIDIGAAQNGPDAFSGGVIISLSEE